MAEKLLSGMSEEEVRARLHRLYEWAGLELEESFLLSLDSYTHGRSGYEHAQSDVMDLLTDSMDIESAMTSQRASTTAAVQARCTFGTR